MRLFFSLFLFVLSAFIYVQIKLLLSYSTYPMLVTFIDSCSMLISVLRRTVSMIACAFGRNMIPIAQCFLSIWINLAIFAFVLYLH